MSLLEVIETSGLIATVPLDVARLCRSRGRIRQFEVPMEPAVIQVHQFSRRCHKTRWRPAVLWERLQRVS
jgi:hypothetical protein